MSRLHDPNVAVRRGCALALGALPRRLLAGGAAGFLEEALDALCGATVPEEKPDDRDVESRVNSVESLGKVCVQVRRAGRGAHSVVSMQMQW